MRSVGSYLPQGPVDPVLRDAETSVTWTSCPFGRVCSMEYEELGLVLGPSPDDPSWA